MKISGFLVVLCSFALAASGQTGAGVSAAAKPHIELGAVFRSRVAGIELCPPASSIPSRDISKGEIARFVNAESSWDIRIKPVPLHSGRPLSAPDEGGILELTKNQFAESNPTAHISRSEVFSQTDICNGRPFGIIEAEFDSASDRIFLQQAIFKDNDQRYLIVDMRSPGKANDQTQTVAQEIAAKAVFWQMLTSVKILDRGELRKEQDQRLINTHLFYLGLDQKKIVDVLQPLHFIRIIRNAKDVGFIQLNERQAIHSANPGVEIIVRSQAIVDVPQAPDLTKPDALSSAKKVIKTGTFYTSSTFFVAFDRRHEGWTTITQLDNQVVNQTTESANSDLTIRRKLDSKKAADNARNPAVKGGDPPVLEIPEYVLNVAYATGPHQDPPTDKKLPPYYLPQALGQLLPRLLPQTPAMYLFKFYVSAEREVLFRYVDVEAAHDVTLNSRVVNAIAISDRIGADSSPMVNYFSPSGEWLGSVNQEQSLQMLPADPEALKTIWPGFAVCPEPPLEGMPSLSPAVQK